MAKSEKKHIQDWKVFKDAIRRSTPIDSRDSEEDKLARKRRLEADPEEWFKYYFPSFSKRPDGSLIPPAPFHLAATQRVIYNAEWYEVRHWARELAKSTRTMMEVIFLSLVGNVVSAPGEPLRFRTKRNVLLISNSEDNAIRLLAPFKIVFEANSRIIQDYGQQENLGSWRDGEFTTKSGTAFRALGADQSPRGTRNESIRPDVILFDDVDTDQDCRNPDIIDKRWKWVEEAVIPTRSINNPLLVIWCGNRIAEDCCVVRAARIADHADIVNIRDDQGRSTWPEKNTEAAIKRALDKISYSAQQKEYFNNPMSDGKSFPEIRWDACPPISELPFVVVYADPAPSNKDKPGAKTTQGNSRKAVFIVGRKGSTYYIYSGFLDVMGTDHFINALYACRAYIADRNHGPKPAAAFFYIENNTLQDPFYDQVYRPAILAKGPQKGGVLGVQPDTRKKPEKWYRIEANLEPINRDGNLIFNEDEHKNPHMLRLEAQFKAAKPTAKELDGPDCIEGAVFIINQKSVQIKPGSIRLRKKQRSASKGF